MLMSLSWGVSHLVIAYVCHAYEGDLVRNLSWVIMDSNNIRIELRLRWFFFFFIKVADLMKLE